MNGSDIQFDSCEAFVSSAFPCSSIRLLTLAIADLHLDCHVIGGKFLIGGVGGGRAGPRAVHIGDCMSEEQRDDSIS